MDKNTEAVSIASIDAEGGDQQMVMPLLLGIEDFEVDSQWHYWMGLGAKVYCSNAANSRWELSAELRGYGVDNISRLASSPDETIWQLPVVARRDTQLKYCSVLRGSILANNEVAKRHRLEALKVPADPFQ